MRKNYSLFILIAFAFLLTSCIAPGIKETNPVGKAYRNSIQVWDRTIPLPEGEWKVIGRGTPSNTGDNIYFQYPLYSGILLFKEFETNKVHSVLRITVESMTNSLIGYLPNTYLNRKDVHHVVVKNNEKGDAQNGWLINHFLVNINPKSEGGLQEAYDYFLSNKTTIPKLQINTFHHFTGKYQKNKYLDVSYFISPEIEGFETQNESSWGSSE